jgi:hypothetical protein
MRDNRALVQTERLFACGRNERVGEPAELGKLQEILSV